MGTSLKVTRDTWCRHRTAFATDIKECKAGVNFHQFDRAHMPCLGETDDDTAACGRYAAWTPEELAEREAMIERRINAVGIIRPAIVAKVQESGVRAGSMLCPACKTGTVRYSQAHNNHVHARCSTPGCVSWME